MHSVSEGVESILDSREVVSKDKGMVCKNLSPPPNFAIMFHLHFLFMEYILDNKFGYWL